jgi:uncharacterized damage-inducible protein DinB
MPENAALISSGLVSYFPAILQLAEYEVWCNSKAISAASALSHAQLFTPFQFGFRTIHATLFHIVEVFQTWSGCVGPTISKPSMIPYDPNMPIGGIAEWNAHLATGFLQAVTSSHASGLLNKDRRIVQLFHLVTHGTHHRTQFITMLRLLGKEPPFEAGDFGGWTRTK